MSEFSRTAWDRLRGYFRDALTFSSIKDAAGAGGIPLEPLADLQQRPMPERSASKAQLLDEVSKMFYQLPDEQQEECLDAFVRSTLTSRRPFDRDAFEALIAKIGWNLDNGDKSLALSESKSTDSVVPSRARPVEQQASKEGEDRAHVFVSYCHADQKFKKEFEQHLQPFVHSGAVTYWSDSEIEPGDEWFDEIDRALNNARVAVLLVTKDFLASEFIRKHELAPLRDRAKKGLVKVLWVPIRACSWKETFLSGIQAAAAPDKPLAERGKWRDRAWVEVCENIKKALIA